MGSLGRELLDRVYDKLSSEHEALLDAVPDVRAFSERGGDVKTWTDCGDWLDLANRLGAEKVLFLRDQPVAVFGEAATPDEMEVARLYRRAWCMSEPRCLFLAMPDELRIYLLDRPPGVSGTREPPWRALRDVGAVAELLRREDPFDLGRAEPPKSGGVPPTRADQRLIHDLRLIRDRLLKDARMSIAGAHTLIGRSILVRYLEDRRILTRAYFEEVAKKKPVWRRLLSNSDPKARDRYGFSAGKMVPIAYCSMPVLLTHSFTDSPMTSTATSLRSETWKMYPLLQRRCSCSGTSCLAQSRTSNRGYSSGPMILRSCLCR